MKAKVFFLTVMISLIGFSCRQNVPAARTQPETAAQPVDYQKMITARVYIKPGKEADFITAAKMMIENSNKEEGCLGYMLYQDPYETTNFIFVEKYKNQAAIDAHFASPYFKEFGNISSEMTSRPMEIKIYDLAGEK
jgi:quinol monooxygenase YgiN